MKINKIIFLYQLILCNILMLVVACDEIINLIHSEGYPAEKYSIKTEDKYILGLYRIPPQTASAISNDTKVVFLMHDIFGSAIDFLILGKQNSLAYKLSNAGYDVWLGNARGSHFSRKHEILNPSNSRRFWDFSFHEIGIYDLPAMIDYIFNEINNNNTNNIDKETDGGLHFIGYSQGVTDILILLSEKPEYGKYIKKLHGMAPLVFLNHSKLFDHFFIDNLENLQMVAHQFDIEEFPTLNLEMKTRLITICRDQKWLCVHLFSMITGIESLSLTMNLIENIIKNPSSASVKQLVHFVQIRKTGKFAHFDYGFEKNQKLYNLTTPPLYDLSRILTPMQIFYGSSDLVVADLDVKDFLIFFGSSIVTDAVELINIKHFDFIYNKNASSLIYDKIIENINQI